MLIPVGISVKNVEAKYLSDIVIKNCMSREINLVIISCEGRINLKETVLHRRWHSFFNWTMIRSSGHEYFSKWKEREKERREKPNKNTNSWLGKTLAFRSSSIEWTTTWWLILFMIDGDLLMIIRCDKYIQIISVTFLRKITRLTG